MTDENEANDVQLLFRSEKKEDANVLDPNNPLLEKFQKALREHLERQINHLKDDIYEYESGTKKNNVSRDQLGLLVYEQQQALEKQQKVLDQCITKLETTTSAREELDNKVRERKEDYRKSRNTLLEKESEEIELRNAIESTNLLVQQMSQWEENLESDITVNKRIFEKTRKDKMKLLEEKRDQDGLIYKLMTRIWYLEQELSKMDVQMKVKEEEREELAQTIALGNTNIEAMESEYRCLMHSWNSVVIAIGNRDKVLNCLIQEQTKSDENLKSIISEIEQVKKLTQKEMRRSEELTMLKDRFQHDVQTCKYHIETEFARKIALEKKMTEMQGIIEQTENDIVKIAEEQHEENSLLAALSRERETLESQKCELEENIIKELEEQVTNNKTALTLQRSLKYARAKNREMEIQTASFENKIASVMSEIQAQKFINFEAQKYLEELNENLRNLGKEADKHQDEMKQLELRISKKQREIDMLNTKYQKMLDKSAINPSSPLEVKVMALEKKIEEIQEDNKKAQQFWLREQGNLLRISAERQEQIQNNNLLRKQILILEQKNLKVSDDLEVCKKEQDKVTRSINNLHSQLTQMGDNFVKTKGLKITMDKDNEVLRQDNVYKLKDAELECLQLQDEIEQLEQDKINMSNELIEINRLCLEWEKKLIGAKETKTTMIQERGQEGEVGAMKAEIHRMNVRYSQLKKVQDVLVNDLEHCISRRDAIVTAAEAREKRTKEGGEKTKINFNRKLDDIRNKTKQMENQIKDIVKKLDTYDKEKNELEEEINKIEKEIEHAKFSEEEIQECIEETITQRQMNFEMLLQVQKKLNTYTDISKGRKPYMVYRTESALSLSYNKELEINSKLTKIVENLQSDFPTHVHELNRICNTLKLPVFIYFQ